MMETKEIIYALKCCHNLDECEDCEYNELGGFCEELLKRDAAKRLEELETEIAKLKQQLSQQQPEWISVEDRLPEPMESVLIYDHKNKRIAICRFGNCSTDAGSFCSHWMPLPEPPKPKEPTFKDVFLKAFPKAIMYNDGIPLSCRASIFGGKCSLGSTKCFECWNQPYFEEEGGE